MSEPTRIFEGAALDLTYAPAPWAFAIEQAAAIDAHWARCVAEKPALFNGRVLLCAEHSFRLDGQGRTVLRGSYVAAEYKAFLAWRDFGFPDPKVCNCFSMAALQSADGAFLLGEMSSSTANAGAIYFAAGTPDFSDVFGDRVDLGASVTRELAEETGLSPEEVIQPPDWTIVKAGPRIACMKPMRIPMSAVDAKARIDAFLAADPKAELARMHIVRTVADIDEARMPGFVAHYLRHVLR
jgi:hypothetical protein